MKSYTLVGNITNIKTGKLDANASSVNGGYPFFTCSKTPLKISSYSYDCECVLVAGNGDLNVKYYSGKFDAYQRTYIIESLDKNKWNTRFLYYFLEGKINHLRNQSIGGVIKYIKMGDLTSLKIPINSLSIQEQIVKELDTLNDIITKKQQQLSELDTLAQATFYEMFGDPIENEKGWEKIKFGDLYDSRLGKMLDSKRQVETDDLCLYIGNSNVQWGKFILDNLQSMTFTTKEKEILELKKGDLLICEGGEAGRCAIWQYDNTNIYFQKAIHRARQKNENINSIYIQNLFSHLKRNGGLKDFITKATIEHLTGEKLKIIPIPIPPFSLQNQFAERIEAIEKQKELINQSIKEVQLLFDYTMDKYFN